MGALFIFSQFPSWQDPQAAVHCSLYFLQPLCATSTYTIALNHLKQNVRRRGIVHHYWYQLVSLKIPAPFCRVHIFTTAHPYHDLKVSSSCVMYCCGVSWGKSLWCNKCFCCRHFFAQITIGYLIEARESHFVPLNNDTIASHTELSTAARSACGSVKILAQACRTE